jgi:ribosomal protein S27AE
MDWDFQIACATAGSQHPGPAYEGLRQMLHPKLEAARRSNDLAALRDAHRRLLDQHMTDCPASYSPRIGDPEYRAALLDYQVGYVADSELDADLRAAGEEVDKWAHRLAWERAPDGSRRVRADTFAKLVDAFDAATAVGEKKLAGRDVALGHPDAPPAELLRRLGDTIFVQAWLPVLDEATAERLVVYKKLKTEYELAPDVRVVDKKCSACSADVHVPDGAKRAVCEGCGLVLEASRQVFCPFCGGPIVMAEKGGRATCGWCSAGISGV